MNERPTHRIIATGAAVFPGGYPVDALELLPAGYWTEQDRRAAIADMRASRDALLRASDHYVLPDRPQALRDLWAPYRQSLRDLPSNTDPLNPSFPALPIDELARQQPEAAKDDKP